MLKNLKDKLCLAEEVILCKSYWGRARGLLFRRPLRESEASWIAKCRSVHSIGMSYPLDLYFLDKKNRVVKIIKNFLPNRISPVIWKADSVIEFLSLKNRDCAVGDFLRLETDEKAAV